jgi:Family of unknown function (DUF6448)
MGLKQTYKDSLWMIVAYSVVILGTIAIATTSAFAHCDSLDGPVVKAAQRALDTGNVNLVLIWVQPTDEPEIRAAFSKTLNVRALGEQARELADRYFFETLVRIHRTGEGASYTGLKPAGGDIGPAIPAADEAIRERSLGPLLKLLTTSLEQGLRAHFDEAMATKEFRPEDVIAGRRYVQAYTEFVHYVERLYEATTTPRDDHFLYE